MENGSERMDSGAALKRFPAIGVLLRSGIDVGVGGLDNYDAAGENQRKLSGHADNTDFGSNSWLKVCVAGPGQTP